jgi:hypothetical protein
MAALFVLLVGLGSLVTGFCMSFTACCLYFKAIRRPAPKHGFDGPAERPEPIHREEAEAPARGIDGRTALDPFRDGEEVVT